MTLAEAPIALADLVNSADAPTAKLTENIRLPAERAPAAAPTAKQTDEPTPLPANNLGPYADDAPTTKMPEEPARLSGCSHA